MITQLERFMYKYQLSNTESWELSIPGVYCEALSMSDAITRRKKIEWWEEKVKTREKHEHRKRETEKKKIHEKTSE